MTRLANLILAIVALMPAEPQCGTMRRDPSCKPNARCCWKTRRDCPKSRLKTDHSIIVLDCCVHALEFITQLKAAVAGNPRPQGVFSARLKEYDVSSCCAPWPLDQLMTGLLNPSPLDPTQAHFGLSGQKPQKPQK